MIPFKDSIKLLVVIAILFIYGCDTENPEPFSSAPTARIMSPSGNNAPFKSGDRILIQVDFSDDVELHEMAVFIVNQENNELVYQRNLHKHGANYRWIEDTTLVTPVAVDYVISAIVTDHELQRTEVEETFRVEP